MKNFWNKLKVLLGRPCIVQFADGRFGVRRLSMFGYAYISMQSGDDYWWSEQKHVEQYSKGTLEEAATRLAEYLADKPPKDRGTPIANL